MSRLSSQSSFHGSHNRPTESRSKKAQAKQCMGWMDALHFCRLLALDLSAVLPSAHPHPIPPNPPLVPLSPALLDHTWGTFVSPPGLYLQGGVCGLKRGKIYIHTSARFRGCLVDRKRSPRVYAWENVHRSLVPSAESTGGEYQE